MTRYTICFDEEKEANILRWMDAQANKSSSLKALVERSIMQEGYNDIFKLAWQQNIRNSTQMLNEPVPSAPEHYVKQPKKKRGRPRKNVSSSAIPKTDDAKQSEEHITVDSALTAQSINIDTFSADNPKVTSAPEIPAEPNTEYVSNNQSDIMDKQLLKPDTANQKNDGYQRPGNVNIDMTKFYG